MTSLIIGSLPSFNKRYWPYVFIADWHLIADIERWCYNNFKGSQWRSNGPSFAFKHGADATLFSIQWGYQCR